MDSKTYWKNREAEQLKHNLEEEAQITQTMHDKYAYMLRQIDQQINDFYARYARREGITIADAQQRVAKMDVQAFSEKAKKYVEEKDFSDKANKELRLYNATMRINRLELLKANIGLEMIDTFNDLEKEFDADLLKRTEDELIRQEEILRNDAGILNTTITDNAKAARAIVNASFNNATWSERLWANQSALRESLSGILLNGLIQGKNPRELAPLIRKQFDTSAYNAERLMRTEMARVQTSAQEESYKRNGFDEFVFISLETACSSCRSLDGKHFPVKDMATADNAPPMHPNCRCSTAGYVDREIFGKDTKNREAIEENKSNRNKEYAAKDNDPDFFVGPNGKALPAEYKEWIGDNKMSQYLEEAESEIAKRYIRSDFRKKSFIGDGSTAAIREFELQTGINCGRNGNSHATKVEDLIRQLKKALLKDLPEGDRIMLQEMLERLEKVK